MNKKQVIIIFILLSCLFLNGCAILGFPFKVLGGTLNILGKIVGGVIDLAKRLPIPPPWVF